MSKRKETYISDELGCLRLISTTQADNILRSYTFQYDGLSRLTGAAYSENGSASTHYGTSYQYELMGNITGLTRSGLQDDNTPVYHYYLQDHLGNNRVVVKQDGTIEQVNRYYPYGGLMGESTGGDVQRYKYNGKELDRMHGLDWYDYGARHYDAAGKDLGRGTFHFSNPFDRYLYSTTFNAKRR